jgi:NUDIX domain
MKEIIYNNDNINLSDVTSISVRIKVLLINNGKLLIGNEDGCFMFIGGHNEDNEKLIDTLKREVKEETGIELDNEVINDPFLKIIYLNKDYPNKGENRESDIYYYAVETNKLPDLENVNYTESEINKHFELISIDLNKAIDIIKENIPNHKDNEIISKDMIIALEEYGRK